MKTIRRFVQYYKPYMGSFCMDLFCAAVLSGIDVFWPLLLSWYAGSFFTEGKAAILAGLPWLFAFVLGLYVIRSLCRYYVTVQGHIMGAKMESQMREDLFFQMERLSFDWHDRHNTGELGARIVSDLFDISELAHHGPENLFICAIKIIGSFGVMFWMNPLLASALFVIVVLMVLFSKGQNYKMNESFLDNRAKIAGVNASLQDSLGGIKVVKSFSNEKVEMDKFQKANGLFLDSKKANYRRMGTYYTGNNFMQGMLNVTLLVVGGLLCAYGKMAAVELSAFALYVNVFLSPVEMLVEFSEMFQKGFSGFQRFVDVMDEVPSVEEMPGAKPLENIRGTITFEDVDFAYEDGEPVLENLSLTIPAGTKTALAGPSGQGKTTVCSLISRFYDPTKGRILIDGTDIKTVTLESLRSQIGLVAQDVYLFDGTIAENIAYGKPGATLEEIKAAARKACIDEFIESLPDQYETRVGERGARLSGGQKQRISIARIFLKDPAILLLDEATSALDNLSEREVQKSLDALCKGRTCIVVAHRLSTIENANIIHVIEEGKVGESGTHEELLKLKGTYASFLC